MAKEVGKENPHLRDYLRVVWKRKWTAISVFIVLVTLVTMKTFQMSPVYKVTVRILINKENPNVVNIQEVLAVNAADADYYQTQYEILRSPSIALRVIDLLDLKDSPEFQPSKGGLLDNILNGLQGWISKLGPQAVDDVTDAAPSDDSNRLLKVYRGRFQVEPVVGSRLVDISFLSHDPKEAAEIIDTHAKVYIEEHLERKFAAAREAQEWLTKTIHGVKKKLEQSEKDLQDYKSKNNLVSIDFEERHNIIVQKLSDLNAALTRASTMRMARENLYKELQKISKDGRMVESLPAVVENNLIHQLKGQLIKLEGEYSELAQKYGPQHPRMMRLNSQIVEVGNKIKSEVNKIAQSVKTEYEVAKAQENSIMAALDEQKMEALELNQKEIHYKVLKREVDTNRAMYENLLTRSKETGLTGGLRVSNIVVVDKARVPDKPVKPRKKFNIILAMFSGLVLGVSLTFFLEYLDNTVKGPDDVENQLKVPFLGPMAGVKRMSNVKGGELITHQDLRSNLSEAFRNIRTNVLFISADKPKSLLLVSSALSGEGKTFIASNMAVTIAQMGKKVLLVDADLRKPRVHNVFALQRTPGLSNYLVGQNGIESVVQDSEVENLQVITSGDIPPNPAELLASTAMPDFLSIVRERFDTVIFDSPPMMGVTDAVELSSVMDGTILVLRSHTTPRVIIERTIQQLNEVDATMMGIILNWVDFKRDSYYYYGSYYRYKYYYSYYRYGHDGKGESSRKEKKTGAV
jgi:capsular exopolysaccharide synthesis family protein